MTSPTSTPSHSSTSLTSTAIPSTSRTSTPPLPTSKKLPTGFTGSLGIWWSNSSYTEARIAEERILRRMPMYQVGEPDQPGEGEGISGEEKDGDGNGMKARLRNVFIPTPDPSKAPVHPCDRATDPSGEKEGAQGNGNGGQEKMVDYINTLEITTPDTVDSKEAVVVTHGYAAALGFFFCNWESIAQESISTSRRTFFIDWLGMGLSSRPSPSLLSSPTNTPIATRVAVAEHFFISSLESWRQSVGLEKMILVGHSLGGYLSAAYAVRYPERVSGLVLVSPAGIPRGPGYDEGRKEGEKNEGDEGEAEEAAEMEVGEEGEQERVEEGKGKVDEASKPLWRKGMMKVFTWGWERGISPFSLMRSAGPLGPLWATKYTKRRFGAQSGEVLRDIYHYIYNMSILKGSGEFCVSHLLSPGAYGRIPIIDRVDKITMPVTFIYGANDWIDKKGGEAASKELVKAGRQSTVHVVPNAGHHVYLDNPTECNPIINEAIKAIPVTV